jgi:ABC-type multidrug transport system ATPase subunit
MIELRGVSKAYRSPWPGRRAQVLALDGVDLHVEPGTALGVVGLNGAGKSTLLRILLGYVRATEGEVRIDGLPPRKYVELNGIAYVPERVSIPRHRSVLDTLRAYAMLAGLGDDAWDRVDRALERLGLVPLADRKVGTLSKGNLQRLAIAQTLIADRRLMVLDEPADGLDPVWIAQLRDILTEWRRADPARILVLTSHNLAEVERLTDRAVLLHNGRIRGEFSYDRSGTALERQFLARLAELEEGRP